MYGLVKQRKKSVFLKAIVMFIVSVFVMLLLWYAVLGEPLDDGDADADYVYAGGATTKTVWKIDKSDMSKVDESASYGNTLETLTEDEDYVYAAGLSTGTVWKIYKSNMSKAGESENFGADIYAITSDANYVYAGPAILTPNIKKIAKSDMSTVASGTYLGTSYRLAADDEYLYVCGTSRTVCKYYTSNLTKVAESAVYGGSIFGLTAEDPDYVYAGGATTKTVWKIDKSDMSKVDESDNYGGEIEMLAEDVDYVYAGGATTKTVWKIDKSDMSKVDESASYGGTICGLCEDMECIYMGGETTKTVWKIDKSDMSKVDESDNYGGRIWAVSTMPYLCTSVDQVVPYWQDSVSTVNLAASSTQVTPDNITLYYRWSSDNASWNKWAWMNDSVDSNTSDVDNSPDKGIESNFINCQATTPDGSVMTVQESDCGLPLINEYKFVDGFTASVNQWTKEGNSPYLNAVDTSNYITTKTDGAFDRWYTFANTSATTGTLVVNLSIYVLAGDGNDDVSWGIDVTGDDMPEFVGSFLNPQSGWYYTGTISGLDTVAWVNAARLMVTYAKSGAANFITIDAACLGIYRAAVPNYCIDFEYQWTDAAFDKQIKTLCMYFVAHTGGAEELAIRYRSGGIWIHIGTVTATGWKNITAVGIINKTYTIQFAGATETNDVVQDAWTVDCMFLQSYDNWWQWTDDASNPDISPPWAWTFDCPNETGYYEFYSVGKKIGYANESAPATADAICHVNYSAAAIVFDINVTAVDFGLVYVDTIVYSNKTGSYTLRMYNNGTCAIDVDVNGTNMTASGVSPWVLSATNGDNKYRMEVYNDSTGWRQVNLTKDTWYSNIAQSTNVTANIRITTPTVFYSGKQMSSKIFMWASVH